MPRKRRRLIGLVVSIATALAMTPVTTVGAGGEPPPPIGLIAPASGVTGEPFSIQVDFQDGYAPPSNAICRWEFRWGSTAALRENDFDETFGSLLFEGPVSGGYCGTWTFTLPWVPVRQYQVSVEYMLAQGEPAVRGSIGFDGDPFVTATVDSTDRRILSSNLPLVQILPDVYILTVGVPVTYRLFLVGGATLRADDSWLAATDSMEVPFTQVGGSTFTITPNQPGDWFVFWNGGASRPYLLGAGYDPPARYRDGTAPRIAAGPYQRPLPGGVVWTTIPLSLSWKGTDSGWGVGAYRLQESRNGGAWTNVGLASELTAFHVRNLVPNGTYRYRVRATDKAGNVGGFAYTNVLRPSLTGDHSTTIDYDGTWPLPADVNALGGKRHVTTMVGASAEYRFSGQNIGWISRIGPGMGTANVYIDNVLVKSVNLAAASVGNRRIVFERRWATPGIHTIKIVSTSSLPVTVDGFVRIN